MKNQDSGWRVELPFDEHGHMRYAHEHDGGRVEGVVTPDPDGNAVVTCPRCGAVLPD